MPSQRQAHIVAEISNPYTPGQPIDRLELFFGRRDVLVSIREHLLRGRGVFLVAGSRRMGKTSLLLQLARTLPDEVCAVRVDLADENAQRFDWLLWRIADAVTRAVAKRTDVEIAEPVWSDYEGHPERLLEVLWPEVRAALGEQRVVLMLDDLDSLGSSSSGLLGRLVEVVAEWRARDSGFALVVTSSERRHEDTIRDHPILFAGVLTYVLGPLASEEAMRLVTWPVEGVITYDYGVPRRLIETASGHPYFLQLLCFEVYERCVTAGWVNQRDLDLIVDELIGREISDFRWIWDASTPQEQATLAALVSLRGARGMATALEVQTALNKAGAKAQRPQVQAALEQLVARGVLERLGALSYRFRVGLLREWLAERLDLDDVVRETRWSGSARHELPARRRVARLRVRRARRRPSTKPRREPAEEGGEAETEEGVSTRFRWLWLGLAATVVAVAAVVGWVLWLRPAQPEPAPLDTPTVTRTAATTEAVAIETEALGPTATPSQVATRRPQATPVPTSTREPTATPPLIVSRPVPAIAFFSNPGGGDVWTIYVMDSDGGNRARVIDARASFLSPPSWSPDGKLLAFVSDGEQSADIWVAGSDGSNPLNLIQDEAHDGAPAWSPDGEWLAFASVRDSVYWELYVMRTDGSDVQRITWWDDASDLWPAWSPDGSRLAFSSRRDGNFEIYTMDRDGGNLLRLTDHPADDTNPAWSPDGSRIAFESIRGDDRYTDIYVMAVGGGEATNLTNLSWATDRGPTWSPDGGRIAFYSDRDGGWNIYVMASDGSNVSKISGDGSSDQLPSWRP